LLSTEACYFKFVKGCNLTCDVNLGLLILPCLLLFDTFVLSDTYPAYLSLGACVTCISVYSLFCVYFIIL